MRALFFPFRAVWRGWSALCDLADARVFTPHGHLMPWLAFALLAGVCTYEAVK